MIIFRFRSPLFAPLWTKLTHVRLKTIFLPFFSETKNLTKDYDQSKKERKKIQCRGGKIHGRIRNLLVVQTIVVIVGEGDNSCTCPRFSGDGGSLARDAGFEKA